MWLACPILHSSHLFASQHNVMYCMLTHLLICQFKGVQMKLCHITFEKEPERRWPECHFPAPLSLTNLLSPPRTYMKPADGDFSPSLQSFSYRRQGIGVLSELEEQKDNFLDSSSHAPFSGNMTPSSLRSSPHVSFPGGLVPKPET